MERSKADHAKTDRHAELHADRGRLQAEGEQKAKELDQALAELARAWRPWWRRLVGR
jgi:hypothetical protein